MANPVSADILSSRSVSFNKKRLLYVHDITSLVFGCGAGILQLESLQGFIMFAVSYLSISAIFAMRLCKFEPSKYFQNPVQDIILTSLFRELAGFVMAWTFTYALLS
ncbi:AAL151Cp [Eremothecium gossypii ATCC 10895]|uniref:ER membrane protein complex subunit 6 n=1 Tax=Eremothecium gossypii (strain ATCC 10895 / CBS 109.51 / FGSC 9923 / NRRL Y-1056) TaxID=284811 RepID=Q75F79_EREGS|nr:AAL151Cp [Eremothecium gossypii ATCC 10895]AAS50215.1 AAL151Cp [Eremothecium gossypii ATCC 10895]AEY94500.1 FAAL151Cp [Eremothecium gossypii FDAG1]